MEHKMPTQQNLVPINDARHLGSFDLGFGEVLALLKHNASVIVGSVLLTLAAAFVYLSMTPPEYTATTLLLIDTRSNVRPTAQLRATDANSESTYVETQVGVLRSERIARMVIADKRLYERPEFRDRSSPPSHDEPRGSATTPRKADPPLALELVPAKAVKEFGRRMDVRRSQSTYIIDISFTHRDPQVAADVANAIAKAYLQDRLNAREEAIRNASTWLQQRALELRRQTQAAETALDEFRNTNSIASSRSALRDLESTAQSHRLISESFMKQFLETSQEQNFSPLDARILSEAWTPVERSRPRWFRVLAIAAAFGLAMGFLFALIRGDGRSRQPA